MLPATVKPCFSSSSAARPARPAWFDTVTMARILRQEREVLLELLGLDAHVDREAADGLQLVGAPDVEHEHLARLLQQRVEPGARDLLERRALGGATRLGGCRLSRRGGARVGRGLLRLRGGGEGERDESRR